MPRWLRQPPGARWGEFGADDQLGRLNLVTPEVRRAALAEAREGVSFLLSLPLDRPAEGLFPGRHPPRLEATLARDGRPMYGWQVPGACDVVNDDRAVLDLQYSTQWDGLGHYGIRFDADGDGIAEPVFYNGFRGDRDFVPPAPDRSPKALALDVAVMAQTTVQGRGVLVDLRGRGNGPERLVDFQVLQAAMEEQGVAVREGDFLCLYTGFADLLLKEHLNFAALEACPGLDGRDPALLEWIEHSRIAALCADNPMVEKIPAGPRSGGALLPLHAHCLVGLGVHLGELWWFEELAAWLADRGRHAFLLTAPPLRLPGAVGSPVSPVATV